MLLKTACIRILNVQSPSQRRIRRKSKIKSVLVTQVCAENGMVWGKSTLWVGLKTQFGTLCAVVQIFPLPRPEALKVFAPGWGRWRGRGHLLARPGREVRLTQETGANGVRAARQRADALPNLSSPLQPALLAPAELPAALARMCWRASGPARFRASSSRLRTQHRLRNGRLVRARETFQKQ